MSPPRWTLGAILALALLLRLGGIEWGLPGDVHRFSYHPDEWQAVETSRYMADQFDSNPHFFNYPTCHIGLLAVLDTVVGLGAPPAVPVCYLLARLVSVIMALATIWLLARLGDELGARSAGLLAAGFLAVLPLHVVNAHFATIDVPLTCWCTLTLWLAVRVARAPADAPPPGPLVLFPLLLATIVGRGRRGLPLAGAALLLAGATFAATSPYVFIDPAAWPQVHFELFVHPHQTNLYSDVGPGWWFHLRWNLPTATGSLFMLAAAVGLVDLARIRRREVWPVLLFVVLVLASLLSTKELFCRYWLPLLPPLALAAAWSLRRWAARPRLALALALLIALLPTLRSRAYTAMMARPDARDVAEQWCREHIPADATIGVDNALWFWSVPLHQNNGGARTRSEQHRGRWPLQTEPPDWLNGGVDYVVFNRTHLSPPATQLAEHYALQLAVGNQARVLPGWVETGAGSPLHDWNYILPQIEIWQAR